MRIALVGVGGMGGVHLNCYKGMTDIELVALCDIRMDMLKEKAAGLSAKLYDNIDDMLAAEKPDLVDICTPTYLHIEQAIKAMEAGAHVLSEKPMALKSEEIDALFAAMEKTGKRYMTAQVVRFMNAYVYLRGIIESKKYGKLESLTMKRVSATPRWSWNNWFIDVDFMQSVLGEPKNIVGVYHPMTDNLSNYAFANYIYEGCTVAIESGWYNDAGLGFTAEFSAIFENGNLILKSGVLTENNQPVDLSNTEKVGETGINISNVDGYAGEIKYFIDCVKNDSPSDMITPESAAATIKLIERTLDSLVKI